MKAVLSSAILVSSLFASTSWAVDATKCGDTVVRKAKELKVLGTGGEEMARAICHDLKSVDRDTFSSCAEKATTKAAIDTCMRTAGRKAMGR